MDQVERNTIIRVKTGSRYSECSDEGAMIGQGSGGGALLSQANLDKGITEIFLGSDDEIRYGSVRILPLMFQDDIMRVVNCVDSARAGNVMVSSTMKSKQLQLNKNKTAYVIIGNTQASPPVRNWTSGYEVKGMEEEGDASSSYQKHR